MYPVDTVLEAATRSQGRLDRLLRFDPCVPNGIPLGCSLPLTVPIVNSVATQKVQQLAAAVRAAVPSHVAVTVKHRLGVDDADSWDQLVEFVKAVSAPPASITHYIVHVRCPLLTMDSAALRLGPLGCDCCPVPAFNHGFCFVRVRVIGLRLLYGVRFSSAICALEDAIELHAFAPLGALACV
jgi:hypothetical protein